MVLMVTKQAAAKKTSPRPKPKAAEEKKVEEQAQPTPPQVEVQQPTPEQNPQKQNAPPKQKKSNTPQVSEEDIQMLMAISDKDYKECRRAL